MQPYSLKTHSTTMYSELFMASYQPAVPVVQYHGDCMCKPVNLMRCMHEKIAMSCCVLHLRQLSYIQKKQHC